MEENNDDDEKKERVGIHMAALHLPMAANHSNLLNIIMSGEIKNVCNVNKRKTVCINITKHVLQLQKTIT